MEKNSKEANSYYCLTFDKDLLQDFYIPENDNLQVGIENQKALDEYFDPSLAVVRNVVSERKSRDWERVNNLHVKSTKNKERWFFSPGNPIDESNANQTPTREEFIGIIKDYAGPELADYFDKYYHQQGFDAIGRTLVQSLIKKQYNEKDESKIIDFVELGAGYGSGTYINIVREGFIKYDIFNAYSKQRIIPLSEDIVAEPIVTESPMFIRVRGEIILDESPRQVLHQIKELSFVINADRQSELEDFFKIEKDNPEAKKYLGIGRFFNPPKIRVLPDFLKQAILPESAVLLDFNQRVVAGSIKQARDSIASSSSNDSSHSLEKLSQEVESIADEQILKPVNEALTFSAVSSKDKKSDLNNTTSSKK